MSSYTVLNQILLKYDEKRYLNQFVIEKFDSLQQDSMKGAPQYELKSFVTMATYWVPWWSPLSILFSYLKLVPRVHDPAGI